MPGKDPCAARPAETVRSAIISGSRPHGRARNAAASMAHQAQTPKLGESDAPSMHSRPKADRRGRSCMATASPKTPKSSATLVKAPTGCRCVPAAATCCRCAWGKSGQQLPPPPHQPPPASAEPRPGALNKWKDPDETQIRDPGNDNRNLEWLVAH